MIKIIYMCRIWLTPHNTQVCMCSVEQDIYLIMLLKWITFPSFISNSKSKDRLIPALPDTRAKFTEAIASNLM